MKRMIAALVCLLLAVSLLAGCTPSEQKLLVGKWTGKADLAEAYETLLAKADPTLTGHIDIEDFQVELTLEFHESGTYQITADPEDLEAGVDKMMDAIGEGLAAYLEMQTGLTIDQLLVASGKTMDGLLAEYFDPNMVQVVKNTLEISGSYEIDDGELTLTDKTNFVIFEGDCEVSKDELELKNGVGNELFSNLMPMNFEKD
jgi:hypothetical protein